MDPFAEKLKRYIETHCIQAEYLVFQESCHSVKEAAAAAQASPKDIVKSICLIDGRDKLIVAIIKGEDWASLSRVSGAVQNGSDASAQPLRLATPDEVLERTGYVCGGVPAFGYEARFLIDPKVMQREFVYTGGGSEYSLVKIAPTQLQQVNNGQIVRIRE